MCTLPTCTYVHHVYAVPSEPGQGIGITGTGVTDDCVSTWVLTPDHRAISPCHEQVASNIGDCWGII